VPIPKDMTTKILQKKYLGVESDIIKQQRVRNKNNDFSSEISYNKRIEKKEIEEIMDDVRENDQCLYYVAVTIILMADSKEELESMTETVETISKRNSVTIEEHYLKQRGIKHSTPYRRKTGGNHAYYADTESCCFDAF
jgi:type IV secretory pathway VirB4 component